ncbi:hypothetical protein BpHYR1_051247 [Brachionus plicatilis]|uniref:Uncharacterized protein n=1 Tax=Brachionus plicatilis TaxID=10195 RepID=A0A3M7T958_BRAPC|nr:hypothetical protein BpHYR1_051247 [Brachionus plicatilis]
MNIKLALFITLSILCFANGQKQPSSKPNQVDSKTPFAKMFNRFIVPPEALTGNNGRNVMNKYQVFDKPIQA